MDSPTMGKERRQTQANVFQFLGLNGLSYNSCSDASPTMPSNIIKSPFSTSIAPGHGEVVLSILPPNKPSISTLSYRYPLKLLSRIPDCRVESRYPASATTPVHLYLLSYGGGYLPGDYINVSIKLRSRSRLVVTTPQGSTKIYKTDPSQGAEGRSQKRTTDNSKPDRSQQIVDIELEAQAGLCYLPDPSVPFERSKYEQIQRFTLLQSGDPGNNNAQQPSLCVLDWVTEGRSARGEHWSFDLWLGRNEVWAQDRETGRRRLLLRDTVILCDETNNAQGEDKLNQGLNNTRRQTQFSSTPLPISARVASHGVLGTVILFGPLFESLSTFFMDEFSSLPRIGARFLSSSSDATDVKRCNVTWTAARVRSGFVIVKFGAPDFESAKNWLGRMLRKEGSIEKEFGEEALSYL